MHKPPLGYAERLTPSLWVLGAAVVVAPMATLVFVPIDATVGLVAGVVVMCLVIGALIALSPRIVVSGSELRVGPAHIDAGYLGAPLALSGADARAARGPSLRATAWHRFRPGIDGVVIVPLRDPDDPVTEWVFSSRTPDRVAAAITRATQLAQHGADEARRAQAAQSVQTGPAGLE